MWNGIWRTLLVYGALVMTMRLLGKRQIGEMQLSELVTTLLLSEIAALPIVDPEFSVFDALIPIAVIVVLEILISFLVTKSPTLKLIFDGRPSVLISRGKLRMEEMRRLRLTIDELLSELRQKDIFDLRQVDYALLEHNGKLSVAKKSAPGGEDSGDGGMAHTLVVDGNICEYNLKLLGKTGEWVAEQAGTEGFELSEILIMTVNDRGEIYILPSEDD